MHKIHLTAPVITRASQKGALFIAGHESPGGKAVTKAYLCPAGVITIGHGYTMRSRAFAPWWRQKHGRDLRLGDTISQADADAILPGVIDSEYGAAVAAKVKPQKQHHYDGAASTTFNCGPGALNWNWAKALAAGNVSEAARLLRTTAVTANGRQLAGLVRRRREEAALIEHGDYGMPGHAPASVADTHAEIIELQKQLSTLGYFDGQSDGKRTPALDQTVRKFQGDQGLTVDGIVGPATRAAIIRALDARLANQSTGTGGAVTGGGIVANDAAQDTPSALDLLPGGDIDWLLAIGLAVGAAVLIWGAFWLYRNRGKFTGQRVPT